MYFILSSHDYLGYRYDNFGDLAIVFEGPYAQAKAPHPITKHVSDWIGEVGIEDRLASIHVICPYHKEENKPKYPLRELRKGWKRVLLELEHIPSVKRILLVCQSALLTQVVMKGVPGLPDTHGTIFTLENGLEVVPTWFKMYDHMRAWKERDIQRWINLVKAEPLSYVTDLNSLSGKIAVVDLETGGVENRDALDSTKGWITVLGVQWSDNDRAYITGDQNIKNGINTLIKFVKDGGHIFMHNGQFDLGFMGQRFRDAVTEYNAIHCTLIRSRARGELVNTLKHLGNHYTDRPGNYAFAEPGDTHDFMNPKYVMEDLEVTWQLATKVFDSDGRRPVVKQFEPIIVMAAEQTIAGSHINVKDLSSVHHIGLYNIERLKKLCYEEYGVDPNKNQPMVKVLLERGHELTKRTPSGGYALDESVCIEHGLNLLLEYRKAVKLDSSFIGKINKMLRPDNTLPHYQQMMGADTGRTTMSNFNHQQASKRGPVRWLVTSRFKDGKILIVDLAQAELRVLAYVSNDEVFAELFNEEDPHRANASRAFGVPQIEVTKEQRNDAKIVIFRIVYGGKPQNEGQRIVEQFFKSRFKKSFLWIEAIKILSQERLYVTDAYGKTRNLLEVKTWRGIGGVGRAGINSPIQGVASHIAMQITYTCWRLFKKYGLKSLIIFGVHDSVVGDIHPDEIDIVVKIVRYAFAHLRQTQMWKAFPIAKILPMQGELYLGESWGWIDEMSEKKQLEFIPCSSHDTITEDDIMEEIYI